MAYYNDITQRNPISVRILNAAAAMLSRAADRHAKKRVYNTTYSELSALTGRELADLGIHPTEIKRISWEAAYGATPR